MKINPNDILRAAGRYVRQFRDTVFVVKLGGEILADDKARGAVAEQLSLLWSFSIPLVIVHGGGPQLDALCERLGIAIRKHKGRRITDAATLQAAKYEFGAAQIDLVAALAARGVSAIGLSGLDAGIVVAGRRAAADVDFGDVGDIERIEPELLLTLLDAGHVPVISPLTGNASGEIFNTNADTLAAELAIALGAGKLIFVMRAPGLLADPDNPVSLVPAADLAALAALEQAGKLAGGMQPKAAAIRLALTRGVPAVHLVSGFSADALLTEVFTNEGSGTMLTLHDATVSESADAENAA